jgi:hypothetical protein
MQISFTPICDAIVWLVAYDDLCKKSPLANNFRKLSLSLDDTFDRQLFVKSCKRLMLEQVPIENHLAMAIYNMLLKNTLHDFGRK